jgi:hyperosmotically inducible protein
LGQHKSNAKRPHAAFETTLQPVYPSGIGDETLEFDLSLKLFRIATGHRRYHFGIERTMKSPVVSALAAAALVLGLSGCDWIKSLWTSGDAAKPAVGTLAQPATQPAEGKIEVAAPGPSRSTEAVKPDEDSELAEKVKSALGDDPVLRMLAIDAAASGGVVTLHGTANTLANRERAGRVASAVPGVKSVKNQLVIVAGS